eukprot:8845855-Heterocapsa_arctica.AAC.1
MARMRAGLRLMTTGRSEMVAPSVSPVVQSSLISCISTPRFAKALQIRSLVAIATSRSVDSTVTLSQYGR